MMYYYPLLEKAIHCPHIPRQSQLIGFAPCTTTRITRAYHSVVTKPKMVDFYTFFNPDPHIDLAASKGVKRIRDLLPLKAITTQNSIPGVTALFPSS
jgi:hypothetical protein